MMNYYNFKATGFKILFADLRELLGKINIAAYNGVRHRIAALSKLRT